ncbi:MAG: hypothetical protein V4666_00675 [Bacteroidota bacterium]
MKNIKFAVVIVVAALLVSCNITEKMVINSDGSGKVSYTYNMSKFLETVSKMGSKEKESAKAVFSESDKDIDSTFHFKDFREMAIKKGDTLTPEQIAVFEKMSSFSVHSVMNKKNGQAYFELNGSFKNVEELNTMEAPASTLQRATGKKTEAFPGMGGLFNDSKITTAFKGNIFTRIVEKKEIVIDTSAYSEADYGSEYSEESDSIAVLDESLEDSTYVYDDYADSTMVDSVAVEGDFDADSGEEMSKADLKKMNKELKQVGKLMEKGFKDSKYVLEYTFPRRIKKVSAKNYKLSKDKKTVVLSFPIDEFVKSPEKLSFTVELENE